MFNSYIPHLRILTQCNNICLTIRGKLLSMWWNEDIIARHSISCVTKAIHHTQEHCGTKSLTLVWKPMCFLSWTYHLPIDLACISHTHVRHRYITIIRAFIRVNTQSPHNHSPILHTIIWLFVHDSTLKHLFHNNLIKRKNKSGKGKTPFKPRQYFKPSIINCRALWLDIIPPPHKFQSMTLPNTTCGLIMTNCKSTLLKQRIHCSMILLAPLFSCLLLGNFRYLAHPNVLHLCSFLIYLGNYAHN